MILAGAREKGLPMTDDFLMHVLPKGFHRVRHYGLFANANRAENIATARALIAS